MAGNLWLVVLNKKSGLFQTLGLQRFSKDIKCAKANGNHAIEGAYENITSRVQNER